MNFLVRYRGPPIHLASNTQKNLAQLKTFNMGNASFGLKYVDELDPIKWNAQLSRDRIKRGPLYWQRLLVPHVVNIILNVRLVIKYDL